jgi:hypothetical protein
MGNLDLATAVVDRKGHYAFAYSRAGAIQTVLAALNAADEIRAETPAEESSEQVASAPEAGWLIEQWNSKRNEFQARWWSLGSSGETDPDWETLGSWTIDSTQALRFAREADAQAYIDATGWTEAKPTDHRWG